MSLSKRLIDHDFPPCKRPALQPRVNQLATPPTTPVKTRVVDIAQSLPYVRKQLNFSDTVYSRAKALFQRGASLDLANATLVGREKEASVLGSFLKDSLTQKKCNSIYVSGPPGTGKSAQTNLTLDHLTRGDTDVVFGCKTRVLRVNCMTISKPEHIFHELYCALDKSASVRKKTFDDLYQALLAKSEVDSLVVVLDEMDFLITKDQQVLFQLFHCASHLKSSTLQTKLIIIGISNALDLTDKFLPRLRSNGFNPHSLQFLPYTAEQIKHIIVSRLSSLTESDKENSITHTPLMHPGAIQMCCKKCATVTGDLRKAFDICYKSIELVEQQARQKPGFDSLTLESAPKVLISHVAKVCASTFGDSSEQKLDNLNLLQKAVLCCLFNSEQRSTGVHSLTVNELYDFYCKHTLRVVDDLLGRIKKGEFLEIVGALESASAVTLSTSTKHFGSVDAGNKQIRPNVAYAEVLKCSEDIGILRRILLARA